MTRYAATSCTQVGVVAAAKERLQGRVPHVVTTNIEHPAVIECLVALAAEGALPPLLSERPSGEVCVKGAVVGLIDVTRRGEQGG